MHTVISSDGSRIAYDRHGSGPTVILVGGAFSYRKFGKMEVKPFALEREIEDIAALIEAEGGFASLWGWSSGAYDKLEVRSRLALPDARLVGRGHRPARVSCS